MGELADSKLIPFFPLEFHQELLRVFETRQLGFLVLGEC